MAGCLATMRPLFKGFGIGHSPSRAYLEKYVPVSSKFARSNGESRNFRIMKLGECVSPSVTAVEEITLSPRLRGGAAHPYEISGPLDACTSPIALKFLKPTMQTDTIISNRDSTAALKKEASVSVHTTTRTSSIYEDIIEPPREE